MSPPHNEPRGEESLDSDTVPSLVPGNADGILSVIDTSDEADIIELDTSIGSSASPGIPHLQVELQQGL